MNMLKFVVELQFKSFILNYRVFLVRMVFEELCYSLLALWQAHFPFLYVTTHLTVVWCHIFILRGMVGVQIGV